MVAADWKLPALGLAVAAAGLPLFQGHPWSFLVLDSGTMPRWVLLGLFAGVLLWSVPWRSNTGTILLVCWLAAASASLFWAPDPVQGVIQLWWLILFLAFFCIGGAQPDLSRVYLWCAFGILPSSLLVVGEAFGLYTMVGASHTPGLFINRTFMGEAAVLVLLANAMSRQWVGVACCLPALALSQNRASWLALIVVVGVLLCARRRYFSAIALASVIPAMGLIQGGTSSLEFRLEIWRTALTNLKLFGWGIGSFYSLFPSLGSTYARLGDRPEFPHNELVGLFFELGVGAVPALALGLWLAFRPGLSREKLLLVAAAILCCFAYPLHMPFTLFFVALVAGHCAMHRGLARSDATVCGGPVLQGLVYGKA